MRKIILCTLLSIGLAASAQKPSDDIVARTATFNFQNSLRSNKGLKTSLDGEHILQKIIKPMRGKVVYLDIWGTWCGACRTDQKIYAPAIKEAVKDTNIVYLNLANRSTKEAWKATICEFNWVGPHIVHYNLPADQQAAVERYLGVRQYPAYYLFDKNGLRTDKEVPRPKNKEVVLKLISEELAK